MKSRAGRGREKRKIRRKKRKSKRTEDTDARKVGKSRNTVFFQWFVAPEGRKVGSLKRRVRSQLARWEMKNCTPLWREAHFEVKMYKTHQVRTTFGHLKRICKDAFSVAGAIQETFSSELLGGQGADFLRGVDFWSIRSSGLLRWFRVTGTALRMTWHFFVACAVLSTGGLEKSQNALVRGCQRCT